MHISLDSALGQQRRLNQVGETISSIAAPMAAYSLRSLTGGDPKVVRVRRESDNHEQDFTASEVSSGALVDFVNSQVTAPLDIRALTATGRDGDFLIAKAAYSLRSLGTRQATLAATGDTVARADGKYVCQVRRSSDDALKSFTADEITDGTLVSFVGSGFISNGVFANTGFETFTNASATGFSATNTSSTGFAISTITAGASGDQVTVTFDLDLVSGDPALSLRTGGGTGIVASNSIIYTSSGSYTSVFTATGSFDKLGFSEGNTSSEFTISNLKVTTKDGFVKTWYDQSVTTQAGDTATGNHATQATAGSQPKIVDAGSLLTAGVTFDGGDSLSVSDPVITASSSGTYSAFSVQTVATSEAGYLYGNASTSNGSSFYALADKFTSTNQTSTSLDNISRSSGQNLLSAVYNNGDAGLLVNGAGTMTDAGTYTFSAGTSDFVIGNRNGGSADATFLTGSINEIIIYNSNQTDNRTAIEANIGEHYSISGIPAFDNSVNGFVETWYDQSGNGNNLTQTTSGKQPTIVTSGAINTRNSQPIIKFIQANENFLQTADSTMFPTGSSLAVTIFHAMHVDSSSGNRIGFFGSNGAGNNSAANTYRFGSFPPRKVGVKFADASSTQAELISSPQLSNNFNSIFTYQFDLDGGTASLQSFNNGSAQNSSSISTTDQSYSAQPGAALLGARTTTDNFSDSEFFEVIAYDSDQLSNRLVIEANMNSYYSIF